MKTYRLALIGFGNVGQGFVQILREKADFLRDTYDVQFEIVAVSTRSRGTIYAPNGIGLDDLWQTVENKTALTNINAPHTDWSAEKIVSESNADIIIEMSYTNLETAEPALTYVRQALNAGKHIVTANKGPVALYYPELLETARQKGVEIGVEGTVMSGTPAMQLGQDAMKAAGIQRIQGILNGTTNYILTQMQNGISYADALAEAQEKGYAEADPTADVEGHDAAVKVVILANLLMGLPLTLQDVACEGISKLTLDDIESAAANNERWKLIGLVEKQGDDFIAQVKPSRISVQHPLASVSGATNAITYTTDLMGDVTLIGAGAGRVETGFAILTDLLAIHRKQ